MLKIKLSTALIFMLLVGVTLEAKPVSGGEYFEIGHIAGRRSVILQTGMTLFKKYGGRGVLSLTKAHSKFFQSRPFVSVGGLFEEHTNIALGYNMGFTLADNGKNLCGRLLVGGGGMIGFPEPANRFVKDAGKVIVGEAQQEKEIEFNLCLVGEIEMEIGLGRRVDLLVGGGARYIFFKSPAGNLTAHATVGLKFNF